MGRAGRELQVQLLLDECRPAVVALSETEIPPEDSVSFKNYKVFYPLITKGVGFRLLLLIREDVVVRHNPMVIGSTNMDIWVKLEAPCGTIAICSSYRQWTGTLEEDELSKFCDRVKEYASRFDRIVALGDMNLDVARRRDTNYYRRRLLKLYMSCIEENGLFLAKELDMSPTFYSHGTFIDKDGSPKKKMTVLDHVFYKGLPTPSFTILPHALTDHRPTLARFDLQFGRVVLRAISRRNFKSISTAAICCAKNAEALSTAFAMDDVEEIHDVIISKITAALDLVAPLEQVQIKDRTNSLYLSSETRAAIRKRDMAANRGNHASYCTLRNRAARLVRRDKLASNARYLQEREYDPKAIWQLANTAAGRSIKSTLPSELVDEESGDKIRGDTRLADSVNKYYITKNTKIRERIDNNLDVHGPATQQQQQQQQQWQKSPRFQFRATTEREVLAAINGLNNTQALGIDGIPVSVLKQLAPIIALPAAHLVKTSFVNALVPTGFKRASVIPLHKKNKPTHLPSSFRPVAILPAFSKVMECLVLQQVSPHLAPLLPPSQFGFRPRRSTAAAISYANGSWAAAKARGLIVAVAGYDLSAAFDTIDVNMVSTKLEDFGVMDKENRWFHDYLSGRKQQVQYNGSMSTYRNVEHGVPQGSILGPLLFLTLVADLPSRLLPPEDVSGVSDVEVGFSAYADDALC